MSKYITTKYNNPCPLCHDTEGKCRTFANSDNVMCMTGLGGTLADHLYRHTKDSSDGTWGVYVLKDPNYKKPSEEVIQARKEKQEAEEKARRERFWASLSNSDRNKNYLAIHKELGLVSSDKEQLKKRGLTDEQISKGKFFSIRGQSELPITTSLQFAGVNPHNAETNSIGYSKTNGFTCPAFSYGGEIIGYQIRNNNPTEEFSAKYYWAKSRKIEGTEVTSHLQNGELPLTYHGTGKETLYIVEGILKPYIAHCIHDIDVVGAAGGQWASSPEQLIHIAKNYKEIVLIPDGGAVANKNICNQINRVKDLIFEQLGLEIKIAWYQQFEKSDGDIDEIESFTPNLITFRQWEFISHTIIKKEFDVDSWRSQKREELKQFHKNLKKGREANFKFKSRYWDSNDVLKVLKKQSFFYTLKTFLLGLRGAKGTGKSQILKRLIKKYKKLGYNIISVAPRRALAEESSIKFDLFFINNSSNNKEKYHYATTFEDITSCIDSVGFLMNRKPNEKFILLLDESEEFLRHLLRSHTLKTKRTETIKAFFTLLKRVHNNDGGIILSDADLSRSVDFVQDCYLQVNGQEIEPFIIENEFKYSGREFNFVEKEDDLKLIIDGLVASDKKLIIPCDCKIKSEALANYLNKKYPTKKIININSHTVKQIYERSFVTNPNETFASEKPDVVLYTSTMGMGVSIDVVGLFDYVLGCFSGVLGVDAIRQALWRYREAIPVILWCPEKSPQYKQEIPLLPLECQKRALTMTLDNYRAINFDEHLKNLYGYPDDESLHEARLRMWNPDVKIYDCPILKHTAICLSQENYEYLNLKEVLIDELIGVENFTQVVGFEQVRDILDFTSAKDVVVDEINEEKSAIKQKYYHSISDAKNIEFEIASELSKNENLAEELEYQVTKAFLKKELPQMEITCDFVKWVFGDYRKKLNLVKFSYYCRNPHISKHLDRMQLEDYIQKNNDLSLINDLKNYTHAVKFLNRLKVNEFIALGEFAEDSIHLKDFRRTCLKEKSKLKTYFGIYATRKTNTVVLLKKLIARLGYSLKVDNKGQISIIDLCRDYREDIYNSLNFKYADIVVSQENVTKKCPEKKPDISNVTTYVGQGLEPSDFSFSFIFSEKKINSENIIQQSVILPLTENGAAAQLIGKKCNFVGNDGFTRSGFIEEFLDFGIKLKSENDGTVHYCDRTQIELINDDGTIGYLPEPLKDEPLVKPTGITNYPRKIEVPQVIAPSVNENDLEPISLADTQVGDFLSFKGELFQIIGETSVYWITTSPNPLFHKRFDTFEILREVALV